MPLHKVTLFRSYPMETGQKIRIENGPRQGDWEVIEVTDKKVRLRCPVTHKEVEWAQFCYFVNEISGLEWPHHN